MADLKCSGSEWSVEDKQQSMHARGELVAREPCRGRATQGLKHKRLLRGPPSLEASVPSIDNDLHMSPAGDKAYFPLRALALMTAAMLRAPQSFPTQFS